MRDARPTGSASRPNLSHLRVMLRPSGGHVKRVTGIGGIFFKAKDAPSLQAWYKRHLGIDVQVWGGAAFTWTDAEGKPVAGTTAWLIAPQESQQFAPSSAPFMVNYRVEDVHALFRARRSCSPRRRPHRSGRTRTARPDRHPRNHPQRVSSTATSTMPSAEATKSARASALST